MEFNHIGVATNNIIKSIELYKQFGFESSVTFSDPIQQVSICFMKKENHPDVELISPNNDNSPINNILNKVGTAPYHLCYSSSNILQDIEFLKKKRFIVVVNPVEAVAFNLKKVCFCYHNDFGLIELVEA